MTVDASGGHVPEFDLADRLRKALREENVGVQDMAEYLGLARTTLTKYLNGSLVPKRAVMRLWALRCGVPLEWLETGNAPAQGDPDGGGAMYARRDSNPQPADKANTVVRGRFGHLEAVAA